ncbi:hypothetical protein ABFA25_06740 [Mycobacterium lepromatosis]|uniref:hypothetical protein n=1 Tax=Mycobacterium lepromatosis TaxID=480418 RepID=UPI003D801CD0
MPTLQRLVGGILLLGIPISLTCSPELGSPLAVVVMRVLGPVMLATFNLITYLTPIAFQISIGLSQTSSIPISRVLGPGNRERVHQIAAVVLVLGAITTVTRGVPDVDNTNLGAVTISRSCCGLGHDVAVQTFLLFAIAQQRVEFIQNVVVGLLRGIGNTVTEYEHPRLDIGWSDYR